MSRGTSAARTAIGVSVAAVILACMAAASGVSRAERAQTLCSGITITIRDSSENSFVSGEDILEYIASGYGKVEGVPINDIDLKKMEDMLSSRSAVLKSEVYCTKDGLLNVSVVQRKPIMLLNKDGQGFYADKSGYVFPVKPGRGSDVTVIEGSIPVDFAGAGNGMAAEGREREWLVQMTGVVEYIHRHRNWAGKIDLIHVRQNGDLVFTRKEGGEKFVFGKPVRTEEKFGLMDCYCSTIVPAKGENFYKVVDVRFEGQIVCR